MLGNLYIIWYCSLTFILVLKLSWSKIRILGFCGSRCFVRGVGGSCLLCAKLIILWIGLGGLIPGRFCSICGGVITRCGGAGSIGYICFCGIGKLNIGFILCSCSTCSMVIYATYILSSNQIVWDLYLIYLTQPESDLNPILENEYHQA